MCNIIYSCSKRWNLVERVDNNVVIIFFQTPHAKYKLFNFYAEFNVWNLSTISVTPPNIVRNLEYSFSSTNELLSAASKQLQSNISTLTDPEREKAYFSFFFHQNLFAYFSRLLNVHIHSRENRRQVWLNKLFFSAIKKTFE